jgi:hypothetical protein
MIKDFSAHFRELAERLLPEHARIVMPGDGTDLVMLVTWRLNTDPKRPSKRSRMIRIVIEEEAMVDYAAGSSGSRLAGDARFATWLRQNLGVFNPNHEAPLGVDPPPATWVMSTLDLNA